ncbi:MAG: SH3 domain-containing protein [Alphaproteobacteria bacterium]
MLTGIRSTLVWSGSGRSDCSGLGLILCRALLGALLGGLLVIFVLFCWGIFLSGSALSEESLSGGDIGGGIGAGIGKETGLSLPRWASLRADLARLRVGPGRDYPVLWEYRRDGVPLRIVDEELEWRRVRDWDGVEGWMHKSLLSSEARFMVQDGSVALRSLPDLEGSVRAYLGEGVSGLLLRCREVWCELRAGEARGWAERGSFFGGIPP